MRFLILFILILLYIWCLKNINGINGAFILSYILLYYIYKFVRKLINEK